MENKYENQWLDLVTVGLRLSLDQGLRSQRKNARRHLSMNERIARRVRKLIKRDGGLKAIQIPGVGYRVREDWLREYEIGLEMDAERDRWGARCGQVDSRQSDVVESPSVQANRDRKPNNISPIITEVRPQAPPSTHAGHKGRGE